MSENTSEKKDDVEVQSAGNKPGEQRSGNPLPLILSGLAVLLAALALIANQMGQPAQNINPLETVNSKLGQIEARIGDMESQLTNDKLDVVNMQLKRILLNLEQLSAVADDVTRQKIDQAYRLLKPLSEPAVRIQADVDIQGTVMPENQTLLQESATGTEEDITPPDPTEKESIPAITAPEIEDPSTQPTAPDSAGINSVVPASPPENLLANPEPASEGTQIPKP